MQTGIHTGGRERGDFPPFCKHKSENCCSKMVCDCSKTPRIFPKVYSSCQIIMHCFLVGGEGGVRWSPSLVPSPNFHVTSPESGSGQ